MSEWKLVEEILSSTITPLSNGATYTGGVK